MNWISLILQLITLRRGLSESHSMMDSARHFAEKGKRTLAAFLVVAHAGLFLFSGLLVAVIDLGLQIDRKNGVVFSGLMISASILVAIAALLLIVAYFLGRHPAPPPPPPESPRADRIKDMLEEFLVNFLSNLAKPREKKAEDSEQSRRS